VRLASWNCCGKYGVNLLHLLDEGFDVAVISEASALVEWPVVPDGRGLTGLSRRVSAESWKELAVVARGPWSVSLHRDAESAPAWMLPVHVDGPTPFTLVGLWSVVLPGTPSYVRQLDRAADWIERSCAGESVVLTGDFNAPIASSQRQYDVVERRLNSLGLVDAYRATRGLEHGDRPSEATYYQYRRRERPFHIDHMMIPESWADGVKLDVGDFDTWVGSGRSDHVPLIADMQDALEVT
jgi:hypothetical protein